jgi:hypothetical protein
MVKDFKGEFNKLLALVRSNEPFCFTRFSDGEISILRNVPLELGEGFFVQGDIHGARKINVPISTYNTEERKRFDPEEHEWLREWLTEAFLHRSHNYFKGIPPQNALDGGESWKFCTELYGDGDDEHLSFANVMINDNYRFFLKEMVPEFKKKNVIIVCNENADVDYLPFEVEAFFPVGQNCMINNTEILEPIAQFIKDNKIKNTIFLFAASTLSNILGYELYKKYPQNQYLDVGSSLGPYLGLSGWKPTRTYLNRYWTDPINPPKQDIDIWK